MTTVDFQLDEITLAEDSQHFPESADTAALEETYFIMPVRLCMNNVELLEQPSQAKRSLFSSLPGQSAQRVELPNKQGHWLPLPLIGFATHALHTLNEIKPGREQKLYLAGGGHLVFARSGNHLSISSSINGRSSSAHHEEALRVFQEFSEKVRELLVTRVPVIQQHPSWGQWFSR